MAFVVFAIGLVVVAIYSSDELFMHRLSGEVNFRIRNFTSRDSSLWTSFPNEGVSASFSFHRATRAISGAAARAIKTMGFNRLYVVSPRHPEYRTDPDAIAFSTHAVDVLQNSVCTETFLEALKDVSFACCAFRL